MPRESVDVKGRRLLTEGRLVVTAAGPGRVAAVVRGDSGDIYRLGYGPGPWWCSCPVRGRCSHLVALQLVTAPRFVWSAVAGG